MSAIKILSNLATRPKGKYVADQSTEVYRTKDGLPTVRLKWESTALFSKDTWLGSKETRFVFARDALLISALSEKAAKAVARWVAFEKGERALSPGGIRGGLIPIAAGAIGAFATKTSDLAGIAVLYRNEEGNLGIFEAAGQVSVIDYIVSSLPQDAVGDLGVLKAALKTGQVARPQRPLFQAEAQASSSQLPVPAGPQGLPSSSLYIHLNGEPKGPFTTDQLKALLAVQTITNDTPCCHEGADAWQTVGAYLVQAPL